MRFKITALEKTPKLKGTYCDTSFPNELENVLKKIIPNLDDVTVYLISFSDFLVDNLEVEVFEDTDVPTEENKNGFSLNICENPDEIFDGIEDMSFFSEVDDIWYEEDGKTKEFPPELKQKLISDFDGEVDQQDYEVDVIGKMKVEELIPAEEKITDKENLKKLGMIIVSITLNLMLIF